MGKQKKNARPAGEAERVVYRKNKYAAPVGGIFLLLALIGLVAVGFFCVRFTQGLLDNTQEKREFERIIYPVLMFDPVPFEHAEDADPLMLLQASIWSTLLGEKGDSYQENAIGWKIVPASDVDVACAQLFGPQVQLEHQTITNFVDTTYTYDESTRTYYVPVDGVTPFYTPSVQRVVKEGDVYTLEVGYVAPTTAWSYEQTEPEIEKLMIYELLRVDGHYQLTAIRDLPTGSSQAPTGWNTFGEQTRPGLTSSQAAPVPEEQAEADASSASEDTEDEEDVEDEEDSSAPEEDAEDEEDSSAPAEDAEDEETSSAA